MTIFVSSHLAMHQQLAPGARGLVLCNDFELSLLGSMRRKRCLCEVAVKEQKWREDRMEYWLGKVEV